MTTKRVIIKSMYGYNGDDVQQLMDSRAVCTATKFTNNSWYVSHPELNHDYLNFADYALEFLPDVTVAAGTNIDKLQAAVDEAKAALAKAQEEIFQMTPKEEPKKEDPNQGFFVGQKVIIKKSLVAAPAYKSRLGTIGKIVELDSSAATIEFPEASFSRLLGAYKSVWLYGEIEPAPWHAPENPYEVIPVGKGYLAADGEHIARDKEKAKLTPAYAKSLRDKLGITDTVF